MRCAVNLQIQFRKDRVHLLLIAIQVLQNRITEHFVYTMLVVVYFIDHQPNLVNS